MEGTIQKLQVAAAIKRGCTSLTVGMLFLGAWVAWKGLRDEFAAIESARYPVLASVKVCEGDLDRATGSCAGRLVEYAGFQQTSAVCDGDDAIVTGTLSKVRKAKYVDGSQTIEFGKRNGRSRRAFWKPLDQPPGEPTTRAPGVQDWGPWRLYDGCKAPYDRWFTTVKHEPWHGFWLLTTTSGPFPLPPHEGATRSDRDQESDE